MAGTAIRSVCGVLLATAAAAGSLVFLLPNGCASHTRDAVEVAAPGRVSATTQAVSLGNLRTGKPPSRLEAQLASFLFGEEAEGPLTFIKPMDLAVTGRSLLVSEGAFQTVYTWDADSGTLSGLSLSEFAGAPGAMTVAPDGDVLIAGDDGGVRRFSPGGALVRRYRTPIEGGLSRVGGIACVRDQVWLTNTGNHTIEVFDAESGQFVRSIGRRGRGPVEFGLPLGIAADGDQVFVVDMLNARVQVLKTDGTWVRDIGGAGDRLGFFGRPKSVAVGPDGVVFVTDSAWQCIHAFARDGRPLGTFGGTTDRADALALPAGIAIWRGAPAAERGLPSDFQADYHVLVAEQIVQPGIRVYAWRSVPEPAVASDRDLRRPSFAARVESPHWRADRCTACHASDKSGRMAAIAEKDVDGLCLSCHDGQKASAEAHPIGRLAVTSRTRAPEGWPLVGEQIGCLTCHDIRRHCDSPARPAMNAALVRGGFESASPLNFCTQCHVAETWRGNPHRGEMAGMTSPTASCGFCHVERRPMTSGASSASYSGELRSGTTELCLNCHSMHADPAPGGHLNAVAPAEMRAAMLAAEAGRSDAGVRRAGGPEPQLLPFDHGRVSCATCHNPHPESAALSNLFHRPFARSRSQAAGDAGKALRVEHMDLCRHCHPK